MTAPDYLDDVAGSGMRAAASLKAVGGAHLMTAVDEKTTEAAASAAATLGIDRTVSGRDQPVRFHYFTPVGNPSIDGLAAKFTQPIVACDSSVLVFGMLERGEVRASATHLVLDPQRPRDLTQLDTEPHTSEHLAIVANAREIAALAGAHQDTATDAKRVLVRYNAEVVVVKESCRGCLVVTSDGNPLRVGPHPTRSVWPLGSGDVFAAAFAYAWGTGAEPAEAASVASNSAAWWCRTRTKEVPKSILDGGSVETVLKDASPELHIKDSLPKVYLAAPFFTLAERWLVELCRDVLAGLGVTVFSPLHDVGIGGAEVAAKDLEGLADSDAVVALLDGDDPGTLYEAGWAHRHGLPVVGFSNPRSSSGAKMLVGTGAEIHSDLSTALYRGVWAAYGLKLTPGVLSQ